MGEGRLTDGSEPASQGPEQRELAVPAASPAPGRVSPSPCPHRTPFRALVTLSECQVGHGWLVQPPPTGVPAAPAAAAWGVAAWG